MRFATPTVLLALSSLGHTAVTPTSPGGGKDVYPASGECSFEWKVDETAEWKSFDVDLMTGSNFKMENLTRVAAGLDGTDPQKIKHSYRCPEVDPPAPIYFYQFTSHGEDPAWTQRFTIAASNGTVVEAENEKQPNGDAVPWAVGRLVNNSTQTAEAIESITSTEDRESLASTAWGMISGNEHEDPATAANGTVSMSTSSATGSPWSPVATAPGAGQTQSTGPGPSWNESSIASTNKSNITGFSQGVPCDQDTLCPEEAPCCSEYGFCGTGRNCLAGCNPLSSFTPQVCAPVPACIDQEYSLQTWSASRILQNSSTWNGDASSLDWLVDRVGNSSLGALSANATTGESSLTLSMTSEANGTTITSTRSLLYGNVSARIKSTPSSGIVTSFSLVSGTEDELAFEFTDVAHSAFYFQGGAEDFLSEEQQNVTNQTADFHDYTISWLPESVTWLVDGVPVRNVSKNLTLDDDIYRYPQTPSRIRFSVWEGPKLDSPVSLVEQIDANSSALEIQADAVSYVSTVNVLCYPTSLLPNFTFANVSHTGHENSSATHNETSLFNSTFPSNSTLRFENPPPLDSSTPLNQSELSPASGKNETGLGSSATPEVVEASMGESEEHGVISSSTMWWSPPVETPVLDKPQAAPAAVAGQPDLSWTAPAFGRLRRWIQLELIKRAEQVLDAYSYGAIDENGQVSVNGYTGETTLASDRATGLNMFAAISPEEGNDADQDSASPKTPHDGKDREDSSSGVSRMQKWNNLPTWAHVLIIGGAALVGLLLVVIIGRCFWRKASGSSKTPEQPYKRIGDQGDFEASVVNPYATSNGTPYDPHVNPSSMSRTPVQRSTSNASSRYEGGYVPSSSLRNQYFPDRTSGENRV